jgi:hypothetical protein
MKQSATVSSPTASPYKLLLTEETMQRIARVPPGAKQKVREALHGLTSGEWEKWEGIESGFESWRDEGDGSALFSLAIPEFGVLLWERAWSVDLLGRIPYPSGAYYEQPPPANSYSQHVVIKSVIPQGRLSSFRLEFDGRSYKQESGLAKDNSWKRKPPTDQVAYEEELYLLSPNILNDLLEGNQHGLPLHLSEEQTEVLSNPGPVLLSGEAGSGKTSVITQWLVINHLRHQEKVPAPSGPIRQLFVTFSILLSTHTKQEFSTMLPKTARDHRTDFMTYRQLLLGILETAGENRRFVSTNEMTFDRFMREYAPILHKSSNIDPVLLWDEIRSVIKGGATGSSEVFLDFERYQKLSDARSQCKTPASLRDSYYDAAQDYQAYLNKNSLWDGVDLARACLANIGSAEKYEKIACDEVQDLAPVEIRLLFGLLQGPVSNLFFTGDVAQVINPSGFLWARMKRELYDWSGGERVPDVKYLRRNYRSYREIVELTNAVLRVRRDLLDDDVSHVEQVPLLPGRVAPMVLREPPTTALTSVTSNPNRRLILTKTSSEKTRVLDFLGKARDNTSVLTIEEAKGLEFEGVLLWNFFIPRHETITKDDWEKVFTPDKRKHLRESIVRGEINPYGLTYEFNLLHVGLTRGRRVLFVYDEDSSMRIANLGGDVHKALASADANDFAIQWKTDPPTSKDLYELGARLMDRDRIQASRMFKLSAEAAEKEGKLGQAAESYAAAGAYDLAAQCYKVAEDRPSELKMLALHYSSLEQFGKAGQFLEERGGLLSRKGEVDKASEAFDDAIPLYGRAKEPLSAARCALQSAELTSTSKNRERALKFQEAADWAGRGGDHDQAILALDRAIQEARNAGLAGKAILPNEPNEDWIARLYSEIAAHEKSMGRFPEAALAARKGAQMWLNLADSPEFAQRKGQYETRFCESVASSIESYIKSGETTEAQLLQEQLIKRFRGGIEDAKDTWNRFAALYLDVGELDSYVETTLQLTDYLVGRKEYRLSLDQIDSTVGKCKQRESSRLVLKLLQKRVDVAKEANDRVGIAESYYQLAEAYQVAEPLRAQQNLHNAAMAYLEARQEDEAGKLLERAYRMAPAVMAPIEIGWYCYKDVALDEYVARGMLKEAFSWAKESSIHFIQDSDASKKRLEANWKEHDEEAKRLSTLLKSPTAESGPKRQELEAKKQTELRSRALAEATIARVLAPTSREDAQRWKANAQASLKESQDEESISLL